MTGSREDVISCDIYVSEHPREMQGDNAQCDAGVEVLAQNGCHCVRRRLWKKSFVRPAHASLSATLTCTACHFLPSPCSNTSHCHPSVNIHTFGYPAADSVRCTTSRGSQCKIQQFQRLHVHGIYRPVVTSIEQLPTGSSQFVNQVSILPSHCRGCFHMNVGIMRAY
ncbi:hypothetical protein BD779DRAFT_230099 [Infundibulicybe gibba]|nr:hypothetical protein BD779DRAFT_230099 [Infundibulicybe gibba]